MSILIRSRLPSPLLVTDVLDYFGRNHARQGDDRIYVNINDELPRTLFGLGSKPYWQLVFSISGESVSALQAQWISGK